MLDVHGRESAKQFTVILLNRAGLPGGLKAAQVQQALRFPVDVTIPDLPRQVTAAVTLGEPAAMRVGAFRTGIVELARQVGPLRVTDTPVAAAGKSGGLARLRGVLGRRK
jgi:hypothetical protein